MSQLQNTPHRVDEQVADASDVVVSFPGFLARCRSWLLALIIVALVIVGVLVCFIVVAVIGWASPVELTQLVTAIWPDGASIR
jgi:ABC-type dipeptide/oligopeptide/nickel transport system permease subunit